MDPHSTRQSTSSESSSTTNPSILIGRAILLKIIDSQQDQSKQRTRRCQAIFDSCGQDDVPAPDGLHVDRATRHHATPLRMWNPSQEQEARGRGVSGCSQSRIAHCLLSDYHDDRVHGTAGKLCDLCSKTLVDNQSVDFSMSIPSLWLKDGCPSL